MQLLVGLGNPSLDNKNNRHNIGFKIIDAINQKFSLSKQKPKFKGLLTMGTIEQQKVFAIKIGYPQIKTFSVFLLSKKFFFQNVFLSYLLVALVLFR